MRCGAKCFIVEVVTNGEIKTQPVTARSSIGARKVVRGEYGKEAEILSVREERV